MVALPFRAVNFVIILIESVISHKWTEVFHEDSTVNGRTCSSANILFDTPHKSQATCSARCLWTKNCKSIHYDDVSKTCVGCNDMCGESTQWSTFAGMRCWNEYNGAHDCADLKRSDPSLEDGVYNIRTWAGSVVSVYCVMSELDGGWTVFLRRFDGSVPFNRTLTEYQSLFGTLDREHWLGLDTIHEMTAFTFSDIYITSWAKHPFIGERKGIQQFANFYIGQRPGYNLHVGKVVDKTDGPIGFENSVVRSNGQTFSTFDDGGQNRTVNDCVQFRGNGGWWHRNSTKTAGFCGALNPTGIYMTPGTWDEKSMHNAGVMEQSSLNNMTIMFKRRF